MKYALIGIVFWLSCSIASTGLTNAYFSRTYNTCGKGRQELGNAIAMSIAGPLSLFVTFLMSGFGEKGWSLSTTAGCK